MSKRVRFSNETEKVKSKFPKYSDGDKDKFVLRNNQEEDKGGTGTRFHKYNADVDSDEETENKKEEYEKLKEEDVEGAEDDVDGTEVEMGITPFNLKEEMEEGDFDVQGNYHYKKENVIRDNWLDNIDWMKVKKMPKDTLIAKSSMDAQTSSFDELKVLKQIVAMMEAGETVTKTLRRLGGKQNKRKHDKRKRPWEREKLYDLNGNNDAEMDTDEAESERKKKLLELTDLIDQMTGAGYYDTYTDTYEKIQFKINTLQASSKAAEIPEGADDDDALDFFGSNIDKTDDLPEDQSPSEKTKIDAEPEEVIKWEYKWKNENNEPLHGPFTTEQMMKWQEDGYFKDGVYLRRTDQQNAPFYSSKRIDFELYT